MNIIKKSRKILKISSKVQWKVPIVNVNQIRNQKNKSKPFKFKLKNLFSHFTSKSIEELLQNKMLDIVVSESNHITGTIQQETMNYSTFKQYDGEMTLYLAQYKVDIECPKFISEKGEIYLWASKGFTDSGWHYDSYENYLGVIQGMKIVYISNHRTNWKCFESVLSDDYNHAKSEQSLKGKFVILKQDEFLYIPQGWFHRVLSYNNTIGLNIWMEGIKEAQLQPSHYQLRYTLNELINKDFEYHLKLKSKQYLKLNQKNQQMIKRYKEEIKNKTFGLQLQQTRTMKSTSISIQICNYIALLTFYKYSYMIEFLKQLSKQINLKNLQDLPELMLAIIAQKLDQFSNQCQNIIKREAFYSFIQQYDGLIEEMYQIKEQRKKQVAFEMVLQHLQ